MLHASHVTCPYQLAICGRHAGRGCGEQLGECDLAICSSKSQGSLSHVDPVQRSHGAAIQPNHKSRGGEKETSGIKADWPSR